MPCIRRQLHLRLPYPTSSYTIQQVFYVLGFSAQVDGSGRCNHHLRLVGRTKYGHTHTYLKKKDIGK